MNFDAAIFMLANKLIRTIPGCTTTHIVQVLIHCKLLDCIQGVLLCTLRKSLSVSQCTTRHFRILPISCYLEMSWGKVSNTQMTLLNIYIPMETFYMPKMSSLSQPNIYFLGWSPSLFWCIFSLGSCQTLSSHKTTKVVEARALFHAPFHPFSKLPRRHALFAS